MENVSIEGHQTQACNQVQHFSLDAKDEVEVNLGSTDEGLSWVASPAKTRSVFSLRPRLVVAATAALAATSLAFALLGGGTAVGLGSFLSGSTLGASLVGSVGAVPAAALAAVAAATAAAGSSFLRRPGGDAEKASKVVSAWGAAAHPLMAKQSPESGGDSLRSTELAESTERAEPTEEGKEEDEQQEEVQEVTPMKRRDPFKGHRQRLLMAAQKRTASWVALLIKGLAVTVDDERIELRLQGSRWHKLGIGKEIFPLMSLAFRLEHGLLSLAISTNEDDVEGERVIALELDDNKWSLELAVALKTLRGEADSGAGISAWGGRPADRLKRPPPAE